MTLAIPTELEHELAERAQQRRVTVESLVREALDWYLRMDSATLDELSAWQEVRDEALQLAEEPTP